MPLVSITRLRVASFFSLPAFLYYALASGRQASRSTGFLGGWLGRDRESGYWTVTVWTSPEAMRAFRNGGIHLRAMPKLLRLCDEASLTHFEQHGDTPPDHEAAYERLRTEGRLSKLHAPSPRQQEGVTVGTTAPQRAKILKPRSA